jgi:hypothetical protein
MQTIISAKCESIARHELSLQADSTTELDFNEHKYDLWF